MGFFTLGHARLDSLGSSRMDTFEEMVKVSFQVRLGLSSTVPSDGNSRRCLLGLALGTTRLQLDFQSLSPNLSAKPNDCHHLRWQELMSIPGTALNGTLEDQLSLWD